jgi:hypothetical protein
MVFASQAAEGGRAAEDFPTLSADSREKLGKYLECFQFD